MTKTVKITKVVTKKTSDGATTTETTTGNTTPEEAAKMQADAEKEFAKPASLFRIPQWLKMFGRKGNESYDREYQASLIKQHQSQPT